MDETEILLLVKSNHNKCYIRVGGQSWAISKKFRHRIIKELKSSPFARIQSTGSDYLKAIELIESCKKGD